MLRGGWSRSGRASARLPRPCVSFGGAEAGSGRFVCWVRSGGEAADFIDTHLVEREAPRAAGETRRVLLTTRSEALSLYRAVLRASLLFVWKDATGQVWRERIRESARAEYELHRAIRDPAAVARLLLSGRDALDQSLEKFLAKRDAMLAEEEQAAARGLPPPSAQRR